MYLHSSIVVRRINSSRRSSPKEELHRRNKELQEKKNNFSTTWARTEAVYKSNRRENEVVEA